MVVAIVGLLYSVSQNFYPTEVFWIFSQRLRILKQIL